MLEANVHQFLIELERHDIDGMDFVSASQFAHIPKSARQDALNHGWVEGQSVHGHRAYRITRAGYIALGDNADYHIRRFEAGVWSGTDAQPAASPDANHDEHVDPPSVPASMPVAPITIAGWKADDPEAAIPAMLLGSDTPPPAPAAKPCIEDGCDCPRYKIYTRCKAHQLAHWRELQRRAPQAIRVEGV